MKNDYDFIYSESYLQPTHTRFIKGYLWVDIFLISFFGIIMAICDPFTPYLFYPMVLIIIVADIGAFFIMSDVKRWQKEYTLYAGVYSLALSIIMYLSFFKTIYFILEIKSLNYLVFSAGFFVAILAAIIILHLKALRNGAYNKEDGNGLRGGGIIGIMSSAGVLGSKLLIRTTTHETFLLIGSFAFLFLAYIMLLSVLNIHRYFLMVKHQ